LVAQTDPEDRQAAEEPADRLDQVGHGLRVAGPFERKTPSGFVSSTASAGVAAGTTVT